MEPPARPRRPSPLPRLALGVLAGLAVFGVGLALALAYLPEWKAGEPLAERVYRERFAELAARGGFVLDSGEPRVRMATRKGFDDEPLRTEGDRGVDWLLDTRAGVRVQLSGAGWDPVRRTRGRLTVDFSLAGRPQQLTWALTEPSAMFRGPNREADTRLATRATPQLLTPGEALGPPRTETVLGSSLLIFPVLGTAPAEHLVAFASPTVSVTRAPGAAGPRSGEAYRGQMYRAFAHAGWHAFAMAAVAVLFLALALQRRLGFANAALLALAALLTLPPVSEPWLWAWPLAVGAPFVIALWLFALWACAESLLRTTVGDFTTSLDALRAGRLGPRGGRALLAGFAVGAALAGLVLALHALAVPLPGLWPEAPSLDLPFFRASGSPVADGIEIAGGVGLLAALALRTLPLRWARAAAALAAGAVLAPVPLHPWPAKLLAGTACCGLLVWAGRRHGLTALLTAAVVSKLLPAAVFAGLYADWMPGTLAASAGLLAAVLGLGFAGLSRSPAREVERLEPPGFVRRLEDDRRVQSEMDLLARMQRGLLPRALPRLDGWEVAAHSVLATEAGGDLYDFLPSDDGFLWLAAGDVAGHGYSCAIAQAMTKAALASLVRPGRTPAEVLGRADAVLRAAGPARNFTCLALLRLDPASGEALLSNAGYPYPLLWDGAGVSELELPSLPLGMGPPRIYEDLPLRLPPGAALVFSSDGLFEAVGHDPDAPYGFERAREILAATGPRGAERILEALLADWRRHLRGRGPLDDTTVVVLKRAGGAA